MPDINNNMQQVALVTGATGAIGKAIARNLARVPGHRVYILARDEQKAKMAVRDIIASTGNKDVHYKLADLSRKTSIHALASDWEGPLHILINNAGVTPRQREETPEGIEMQFATNVLGYFWMIKYFTEIFKSSAPARIINVASYWAGDLDLNDLEFNSRRYNNNTAYRQSKQADRMLTVAFAERLKPYGITVNACHPGDVNSTLSNNLGFGGHESPDQGACTPVWLAINAQVGRVTGKYFSDQREDHCYFGRNKEAVEELYRKCMEY